MKIYSKYLIVICYMYAQLREWKWDKKRSWSKMKKVLKLYGNGMAMDDTCCSQLHTKKWKDRVCWK